MNAARRYMLGMATSAAVAMISGAALAPLTPDAVIGEPIAANLNDRDLAAEREGAEMGRTIRAHLDLQHRLHFGAQASRVALREALHRAKTVEDVDALRTAYGFDPAWSAAVWKRLGAGQAPL